MAGLKKAGFILIALALVSKFLGLIRESLTAYYFGAGAELDAYIVGNTWPQLIMWFFAGGGVVGAYIPLFRGYIVKGEIEKARRFSGALFTILTIFFALFTVASIIEAPLLVDVLAPGMPVSGRDLAIRLCRIMLPSMLFLFFANYVRCALNSFDHFTLPGFRQTGFNIVIIIALLMSPVGGIEWLAYGFVIGTAAQFIIQAPAMRGRWWTLSPTLDFSAEIFKPFFALFLPIIAMTFLVELNLVFDKMVASYLGTGNIAALGYAERLMDISRTVIGVNLATVILPKLSGDFALGETEEFSSTLNKGIRALVFTCWPIVLIFLFFPKSIVHLLFERGLFDSSAAALTTDALLYYNISAFFLSLNLVLIKAFQAQKQVIFLMTVVGASVLLNIELNLILSDKIGIGGITLATSISAAFQSVFFLKELHRQKKIHLGQTIRGFLEIAAAQTPAFVVGYYFHAGLLRWGASEFVALIAAGAIIAPPAILTLHLMKNREYLQLLDIIKRRVLKKR